MATPTTRTPESRTQNEPKTSRRPVIGSSDSGTTTFCPIGTGASPTRYSKPYDFLLLAPPTLTPPPHGGGEDASPGPPPAPPLPRRGGDGARAPHRPLPLLFCPRVRASGAAP